MKKCVVALSLLLMLACHTHQDLPHTSGAQTDWKTQLVPPSKQQENGDAEAGLQYILYGNYIGGGIPFEFIRKKIDSKDTVLSRDGDNAYAAFFMNVFEAESGAKVMSGNCFTCHASRLNGQLILGLGNSFSDFQKKQKTQAKLLNLIVKLKYKKGSPEREAFYEYGHLVKDIAPSIVTNNRGVNPAFRLEEACANQRDPQTLEYHKEENFDMVKYTLASDVPPLWNVKKKNALYYNAMGRGDHTKLLMQAAVLGIPDSAYARNVVEKFKGVKAWIDQLEPPEYPKNIDGEKANMGKKHFEDHCSRCHGKYDGKKSYPNKLVSLNLIKTDPLYALYFTETSGLADWYNRSWFATSEPLSRLKPSKGYIVPPLDGIWASAPYLHNGSVPTLEALLNSQSRPIYWLREGGSSTYDYENIGWKYSRPTDAKDRLTYDTTLPGYGNQGHYFGDKLTEEERAAVIEYLKRL